MGPDEALPCRLALSIRRRIDAVRLQNATDRGVGDLMAKVGERALDAVVTPGWVLTGVLSTWVIRWSFDRPEQPLSC